MTICKLERYQFISSILFFFFFYLVYPKNGSSQAWLEKADKLAANENFTDAIKAVEPFVKTLPQDTLLVRVYKSLGDWYGSINNLLASTGYYEKSLALENKLPYKRPSHLAYLYNNLAYNYELLYQGDQVVAFYKKAHHLWFEKDYKNFKDNITAFGNLIPALLNIGLLKEAEFYFSRLLGYAEDLKNGSLRSAFDTLDAKDRTNRLMYIQLTIIRYYTAINDKEGIARSLAVFDSLVKMPYYSEDWAMYLEALENAGYAERFKLEYTKALYWYKKADQLAHNDFYKMKGAANQGVTNYYAGNYANAIYFIEKALSFLPKDATTLSAFGLRAMRAELLMKQQKDLEGIEELENIFSKQTKRPILKKDFLGLNSADISKYMAPQQISILLFAGNTFKEKYNQQKKIEDLRIAHHFYELGVALFGRYYALEGYSDLMDYFRKELNGRLLETGMLLGLNSKQWLDIFEKLENNSSKQTWKKFLKAHSQKLGIPVEWLGLRRQLLAEKNAGIGTGLSESSDRIAMATRALDSLEQLIHKKSNKFLAFDTTATCITCLLEKMGHGQGFLRFFITVNEYYGMFISKDTVIVKRLGEINKMDESVKKWVFAVKNPQSNIQTIGLELWKNLLAPFYPVFFKNKSVIILPDGLLNFVAFEPLMVIGSNNSSEKLPFISYGYDVKMLQLQLDYLNDRNSLIAFAPVYKDRVENTQVIKRGADFYALPGAQKEAAEVADLLRGKFVSGKEANRNSFLDALGKYGVYHLAMHADMDTLNYEQSHLVFSDQDKLYFNELYAKPFDAEMMVLSACNTGVGFLNPGEGVMSLSRALAYGGVQSSVYALWELPDAETSWIIKVFYEGLKEGLPKHEALAVAKARFRESFPEKSHPFFWAGLVINGNTEPIAFTRNSYYWFLLIIPFLGIGFWFGKRNKRNTLKDKNGL